MLHPRTRMLVFTTFFFPAAKASNNYDSVDGQQRGEVSRGGK